MLSRVIAKNIFDVFFETQCVAPRSCDTASALRWELRIK